MFFFVQPVIIFAIIFTIYLHFQHQYKRNNNLELNEVDYIDQVTMQKGCDTIRQPVVILGAIQPGEFQFGFDDVNHSVSVKDTNDLKNKDSNNIILSLDNAIHLLESDVKSHLFSEGNSTLIKNDATIYEEYTDLSNKIAPYPNIFVNINFDILFGSKNTTTPTRSHAESCRFFAPVGTLVHIRMMPYVAREGQINNFVGNDIQCAKLNLWTMSSDNVLDFYVLPGQVLYVPPYWWYSIQFDSPLKQVVASFSYQTVMNTFANIKFKMHGLFWKFFYMDANNEVLLNTNMRPVNNLPTSDINDNNDLTNELTQNIKKIEKNEN